MSNPWGYPSFNEEFEETNIQQRETEEGFPSTYNINQIQQYPAYYYPSTSRPPHTPYVAPMSPSPTTSPFFTQQPMMNQNEEMYAMPYQQPMASSPTAQSWGQPMYSSVQPTNPYPIQGSSSFSPMNPMTSGSAPFNPTYTTPYVPQQQQGYMNPATPMSPYAPYPKQQKKKKENNGTFLKQFKTQDGAYDVNKMMNTAGQVVNTVNQMGGMFKQIGGFFLK